MEHIYPFLTMAMGMGMLLVFAGIVLAQKG
jgi:hypothetical protein